MTMYNALKDREKSGNPIQVGLVGSGQMGEGLVCQMEKMHGMHVMAVADVLPGKAEAVFASAGIPSAEVVITEDLAVAAQAVKDKKRVATTNASLIPQIEGIEIVVEATGIPDVGARVAMDTILCRKHILQMNVETDATVGFLLRRMAQAAKVVYTLTGGDEPGACMDLYDFAASLGFDVVCVGKGKNNPVNLSANPTTLAEQAKSKKMSPKMLTSFVDGTKTMVEMTSLGNGIGYVPDVRGMHGAVAQPGTLSKMFVPKKDGGIFDGTHVVDYCNGVAPGVFLIFTTEQPKLIRDLEYLHMGSGPYYSLYRPYHLTSLETPISIARAVLKNETTLATDTPPVAETVTVAKKDLKAGEKIDSLGGYTIYGTIERADKARSGKMLPAGLSPNCLLKRDVRKGEILTYDDVEINDSLTIVQLRKMQDQLIDRVYSKK